jgi:phosphoribosylamine-glycine ligase
VLVAGGYPGKVESGKEILGLEEAKRIEKVKVYHAGTADPAVKSIRPADAC